MSKIGKRPIPIPEGVKVEVKGDRVIVEGPLGKLETRYEPEFVEIEVADGEVRVHRKGDRAVFRARHGLYRALIANMVRGVKEKWERRLLIQGLGYKARMEGRTLVMELGFSHPVKFPVPDDVEIEVPDNNTIVVRGIDKQRVGQVAADIRKFRPPDPYHGKGIRYADEVVRLRPGKAGVKTG